MRDKRGFTLIELLTVVVIIGLLAAIAIPKFTGTKERANLAAMKSDLRNLAASQENYFVENLAYTTTLSQLQMNISENVTVTIPVANAQGFRGTADHAGVAVKTCEIYFGSAGGVLATQEGVVTCG